ncbi:RRXRR domain-containing protein [Salicibibacter kimchii]|uniref:RRXRR domain-containing protein n=1 Tax=Salicibibacter kimchii TaxID=2099786 RepID=A0A345BYK2_9BACI|nr:RRXRR domain-containing protein [Salicibibacter kimchii]AXF56033.1 hypothetical protein DT065_08335 [Salicibibacter kimchii]
MNVYFVNQREEPLMPTRPQKARKLLKQEKAKVYKRTPFTIQLQYPTGENKQDISLGVAFFSVELNFIKQPEAFDELL